MPANNMHSYLDLTACMTDAGLSALSKAYYHFSSNVGRSLNSNDYKI